MQKHYETLGLKPDCSQEDIKKAFIELTKEHHPDVTGGDSERAKRINAAYAALSRAEDRQKYDAETERFVWKPNPAEDPMPPRAPGLLGFLNQKGRSARNVFTAVSILGAFGILTTIYFMQRDRMTTLDGHHESGNDIVARKAARAYREARERAKARTQLALARVSDEKE